MFAIGKPIRAAVDLARDCQHVVAVSPCVEAAIVRVFQRGMQPDRGHGRNLGMPLEVDADAPAEGAIVRAAGQLDWVAPFVALPVARIDVAEILAAFIRGAAGNLFHVAKRSALMAKLRHEVR